MIEGLFQPVHLLVIAVVALLMFGPKKLPELGKGLGEGIRGFRESLKEPNISDEPAPRYTESPLLLRKREVSIIAGYETA